MINKVFGILNFIVKCFYVIEGMLKILVRGLIFNKDSYLSDISGTS